MPGDATGPVGLRVPEADFRVLNASSYTTANGAGTYLLRGDDIIMISRSGQASRFKESQARPMGRDTGGVRGMKVIRALPQRELPMVGAWCFLDRFGPQVTTMRVEGSIPVR
mgnify:CR=1 FL=1